MKTVYFIDNERIISEEIDQETVVINLETGCYYNFNQTASYIYDIFNHQKTIDEVITMLCTVTTIDHQTAVTDVNTMLAILLEKQLLSPINDNSILEISESHYASFSYETPDIEEFDDMQEMLLLDPIHEVKEEGWPYKKDES